MFDRGHALQNHVKRWCEEREGHFDEPPRKKMKFDSEEDDELFEYLMKENENYKTLAKFARAHNEDKRQRKVEKYENQGLSTKKAIQKANHALRDEDVRAFLLKYASLLSFFFKLRDGYLHDKVINSIEKYLEENIELKKAIRISLKKYKHHLE